MATGWRGGPPPRVRIRISPEQWTGGPLLISPKQLPPRKPNPAQGRTSALGASVLAYIAQRDNDRCKIPDCAYSDRRIRARTGPRRPSIDHIVPRNLWTDQDGPDVNCLENLRLAHLRCNSRRGAHLGTAQMLLIG